MNINSYETNLNEILEYRKTISSLQNELSNKDNELNSVFSLYNDLKSLHEKLTEENQSLQKQIITILQEKEQMEMKYQTENNRLKTFFTSQKTTYENQLKSLTTLNETTLKAKIAAQLESKYLALIKDKEEEIDTLNNKVLDLQREKNKLQSQFDLFKQTSQDEIQSIKQKHENELKQLMFKITDLSLNPSTKNKSIDGDDITPLMVSELKLQLTNTKSQINSLNAVIANLKSQNNSLIINGTVKEENYRKELNEEKLLNQSIQNQLIEVTTKLGVAENETQNANAKIVILENSNQSLKEENDYLNKINANLINNQNMNIDDIAKMKLLLENKEKDYIDTIENLKQKVQDTINNLTSQVKQSQEQTEEVYHEHQKLKAEKDENEKTLNEQLNETQNQINKIINEKRTLMEQLKQLQQENEFLKGDYDDKIKNLFYYEHEYKCLDDKFRNVNNKNAENESKIIVLNNTIEAKQNEINKLNDKLLKMETTSMNGGMRYNNSQYETNMKMLLQKKNYYKRKCKECNENIDKILAIISPSDRGNVERILNSGNLKNPSVPSMIILDNTNNIKPNNSNNNKVIDGEISDSIEENIEIN
jgi:chromosome segregation ATPase